MPSLYQTPSTILFLEDGSSLEINTKGSWLDHWDGPRRLYGDYSDDQFRAMLIGHELGHAYDLVEALGGFGVRKHADFDQRILEECFK